MMADERPRASAPARRHPPVGTRGRLLLGLLAVLAVGGCVGWPAASPPTAPSDAEAPATAPSAAAPRATTPPPSAASPTAPSAVASAPAASASPSLAVPPAALPTPVATAPTPAPLAAAPVPRNLVPALANARADRPVIYTDGCHLDPAGTRFGACAYGNPRGATTVVLFGDSHAAQWFPALERIATVRGWRLVSLTKSGCASADVQVYSPLYGRRYTECDQWRRAALWRIARERPALVVVSNSRRYSLLIGGTRVWSTDHEDAWSAGLRRTLDRLAQRAGAVVLIGDTPRLEEDPVTCLPKHRRDASACANPHAAAVATKRLAEDRRVAAATTALFVDPTRWLCRTDPCPAVVGRALVYRDTHHMTATYARSLAPRLIAAIRPALASP